MAKTQFLVLSFETCLVFDRNCDFLILISLQPDVVDLWCLNYVKQNSQFEFFYLKLRVVSEPGKISLKISNLILKLKYIWEKIIDKNR